ncbi:MAG: helix-turn-helix domain-containing protein [Verrucomicrobiota bacterium]
MMTKPSVQLTSSALPEKLPPWGVLVRESHHANDFFMEWRTHAFLKVLYFRSGESTVHVGNRSYHCSEGDIVFVSPKTANRIEDEPGSGVSLYILCIAPVVFQFDRKILSSIRSGHRSLGNQDIREVENGFRRLRFLQSSKTTTTSIAMTSVALGMVATLLNAVRQPSQVRGKSDSHEIMQSHIAWLEQHFVEAKGISEAAADTGMSRRYFTRLFREISGKSWLEFVHDLRIRHACELLKITDLPISTVAFECGYNDLSTFYRRFGKRVGSSPLQWRERTDFSG